MEMSLEKILKIKICNSIKTMKDIINFAYLQDTRTNDELQIYISSIKKKSIGILHIDIIEEKLKYIYYENIDQFIQIIIFNIIYNKKPYFQKLYLIENVIFNISLQSNPFNVKSISIHVKKNFKKYFSSYPIEIEENYNNINQLNREIKKKEKEIEIEKMIFIRKFTRKIVRYLVHIKKCLDINCLVNISFFKYFHNLETLSFGDNFHGNLSSLSSLTKLKRLEFGSHFKGNVSSLSSLTKLESLKFGDNFKGNFFLLSELIELNSLEFGNHFIGNVSSLSKLTKLKSLKFGSHFGGDISSLSSLIQIKSLKFGDYFERNISSLSGLNKLKSLEFGNNFFITQFDSLVDLVQSKNLRVLILGKNGRIMSIFYLDQLIKLDKLTIDPNTYVVYQNKKLSEVFDTLRQHNVQIYTELSNDSYINSL